MFPWPPTGTGGHSVWVLQRNNQTGRRKSVRTPNGGNHGPGINSDSSTYGSMDLTNFWRHWELQPDNPPDW
jgi:hypothetical protein